MKNSILFVCLFSFFHVFAQEESTLSNKHFGVAVNSSIIAEMGAVTIAPTAFFYVNKHQIDLGFAIHPFYVSRTARRLGAELNYRYFPNGIDKRFNLYFLANLTYTNEYYDFTSPTHFFGYEQKTNFLTFTGGSGFQLSLFKKAYIGTSLNLGVTTCSSKSISSGTGTSYGTPMLGEYYFDAAVRLNVGYRF